MTDPVSPEVHSKLAEAVERMPAFPRSVQQVLELTRDLACKPKDLVSVIEKDPVIAIKVLRVANSPYYNPTGQVTSIQRAVAVLGLNTVKNLALGFASIGTLQPRNPAAFDIGRYLGHSLTTAAIARTLCARLQPDGTDPMDCYTAGLLHDFGKVVLAQFVAPEFRDALICSARQQVPLHEVEQEVIGADHAMVGAMLVQKWQLPEAFAGCIRDHHSAASGASIMGACLFAADQISKKFGGMDAGNRVVEELPDAVARRLGGDLADLAATVGDLEPIRREAAFFSDLGAA